MKDPGRIRLERKANREELRSLIKNVLAAAKAGKSLDPPEPATHSEKEQDDRSRRLNDEFEASRNGHAAANLLKRLEDQKALLEVDKVIDERHFAPRAGFNRFPTGYSKRVARQMILVAFLQSEERKSRSRLDDAEAFQAISKQAQKACNALSALISRLASITNSRQSGIEVKVVHRADVLSQARLECQRLSQQANRRKGVQHETEFAWVVFEAWHYLTGDKAATRDGESPFLDFARAAWRDAYDVAEPPTFAAAVKNPIRPSPPGNATGFTEKELEDELEFTQNDLDHATALAASRQTAIDEQLLAILRDKPLWLRMPLEEFSERVLRRSTL